MSSEAMKPRIADETWQELGVQRPMGQEPSSKPSAKPSTKPSAETIPDPRQEDSSENMAGVHFQRLPT